MAVIYCRSTDGNDADDGSTWALAKATLAAALTAAGSGGTVYVSDNHAESVGSAITLASPGTATSPVVVLCVDDSAAPPTALATTGTVTTTGTNSITCSGFAYCYGLTFSAGTGGGTASFSLVPTTPYWWRFEACKLVIGGSSSGSNFTFGNASVSTDDGMTELVNTTFTFGAVGQTIFVRAPVRWWNTASAIVGSVPTILLKALTGNGGPFEAVGVDLSAMGSGKSLVDQGVGNWNTYRFVDCKLGASVSAVTGTHPGQGGSAVDLINCDSGDTNYRNESYRYQGSIVQETTIVRSGGASDGTTPFSRKMVSSANSKFYSPLTSDWITLWNETTSAITLTVEVVTDNVTLTNAEAWLEVEYLGTSGFPLGNFAHDRSTDFLAAASNQTSSSVTWTTTGLTTPVKQALAVTVTPAEKGPIRARVHLAKVSTTMYVDPYVTVS